MSEIIFSLKQNIGQPHKPVVQVKQQVQRGELLAVPQGLGANLHASFTGQITAITNTTIVLKPDAQQDFSTFVPLDRSHSHLETIVQAGIVGCGGAGFPTGVKLQSAPAGGVFIANGAECEALLEHNVQFIQENPEQLVRSIKYCLAITHAHKCYIALKAKQQKAICLLTKACSQESNLEIFTLPDLYPEGDERVLVREILGVELQPGQLPSTVGATVENVETLKHIGEAIEEGKPFIDKDLTVAGRVGKGSLVCMNVPLGTTVYELVERAGGLVEPYGEIVLGGPMMGGVGDINSCITKTTGGVLVSLPFPQEKGKVGILVCECGGSEERLQHIAQEMGAHVVAVRKCKRMVEVKGRYRCDLPGVCPGQAGVVLDLRKAGMEVLLTGSCSN